MFSPLQTLSQVSVKAVRLFVLPLATLAFLSACEEAPEEKAETPVEEQEQPQETPPADLLTASSFDALPGWQEDDLKGALPALRLSCGRLLRSKDDKAVGPDGIAGRVADWRQPCAALAAVPEDDDKALRAVLEAEFQPFVVSTGQQEEGLFTGYYEASLKGSLTPQPGYAAPLYGFPKDAVTVRLQDFRADLPRKSLVGRVVDGRLRPYYSRKEIDQGVLKDQDLEVMWVSDPVDSFFLHIQGSGQVTLPDGSAIRVGFAGSNGLPFYPIGRALIDEGHVSRSQASMQSIRDWLRANPEKAQELMQRNRRFIFFRKIEGPGPIGALGVALTPARSLAVDPSHMPLGAPLWLETTWPGTDKPLQRLMVAQDTGSAIKGKVRGDFFWGSGEPALAQAGGMKQKGRYWLLLPKAVAERRNITS
ncbi:murein transglycosylase A [Rhodovibrionaceae bacterium A322]